MGVTPLPRPSRCRWAGGRRAGPAVGARGSTEVGQYFTLPIFSRLTHAPFISSMNSGARHVEREHCDGRWQTVLKDLSSPTKDENQRHRVDAILNYAYAALKIEIRIEAIPGAMTQ